MLVVIVVNVLGFTTFFTLALWSITVGIDYMEVLYNLRNTFILLNVFVLFTLVTYQIFGNKNKHGKGRKDENI